MKSGTRSQTRHSLFVFYVLFVVISLSLWTIFYYGQNVVMQAVNNAASLGTIMQTERPLLILHVGPGKTGTTTVQWFAEQHGTLLQEDNIYYLAQDRHALARTCRNKQSLDECHAKWKEFHNLLEHHYKEGHDVLISEEGFSAWEYPDKEQAFVWDQFVPLQQKWRIRVIYAYRPYFEWLPSKYAQAYNPKAVGQQRSLWPHEGGTRIPSFSQYYTSKQKHPFRHPLAYKQRWEERFQIDDISRVEIFNMKEEGEFLPNFYCTMVPEANSVCEYLSSSTTNDKSNKEEEDTASVTMNSSSEKFLHYDMIAVEAKKRKWIPKGLKRPQVRLAVEHHATQTLKLTKASQFPLECLEPDQSAAMLEQSIQMAREMLPPQDFSKEELERSFQQAVEKKLFCSVHVDKVLQNYKWEYFFRSLTPEQVNKQGLKEKKRRANPNKK